MNSSYRETSAVNGYFCILILMGESVEESRRVSVQISSLSTQLIESIDKQSRLEEQLNQAKRTIQSQRNSLDSYNDLKSKFDGVETSLQTKNQIIEELKEELVKEKTLRTTAERNVDDLNKEIEDLTASLFDEANKMVATARKESYTIEIKNNKLKEQLDEKDMILETLNLQLKNLKKVLQNLEKESTTHSGSRSSFVGNDNSTSSISLNKTSTSNSDELSLGPIYSPNITSVRYDLNLYTEFLKFIAVLPYCETLKDTSSDSKLLRRLVNDEIQPALRLDNASGLGWIVRRTLMSLMMEGLVVVEPLSGLNENFQYGYTSPVLPSSSFNPSMGGKDSHLFSYPSDSPPIAVHDKCSFCSEARDDVIEHARMYVLKTQTRIEDGSLVVTNSFPLCRYCLLKVRQTCEIFAFLRSLKLGAWNLEKVTLTKIAKGESSEFSQVSNGNHKGPQKEEKRLQRMSLITGKNQSSKLAPQVDIPVDQIGAPTTNIQRAWLQLCKLRITLHWAHIGIWSVEDAVTQKIGPFVKEEDENDDEPISPNENPPLRKVTSEDGSFTLKNSDEIDEINDDDAFDFEKGKAPVQTAEITEATNNESRTSEHAASQNNAGQPVKDEVITTADSSTTRSATEVDPMPSSKDNIGSLDVDKVSISLGSDSNTSRPVPADDLESKSYDKKHTDSIEGLENAQETGLTPLDAPNDIQIETSSISNNDEEFDDAIEDQDD